MPTEEAREIAYDIYQMSSEMQDDGDDQTPLHEKVKDACTAYQEFITDLARDTYGLEAGVVTDPDARVESLPDPGHTIGFIKVNPDTDELIAFDATIAQNGQIHHRRKAKIWFGNAQQLSSQLKSEFGGSWEPGQILGAVGDFSGLEDID